MSAPYLTVYANGVAPVTGDGFNTFVQSCDNMAQLRAFVGVVGQTIYVRGTTTANDGGQGTFYWNTGNIAADDNGVTTVVPNGSGTGAWTRSSQGFLNPLYLGTAGYSDTGVLEQATGNANSYEQIILQNTNSGSAASVDFVVSNNLTTPTTYYGDFGINSSAFSGSGSLNKPNAVFLTSTSGDLVIGTTTVNSIRFVYNGNSTDSMVIGSSGVTLSGTLGVASSTDTPAGGSSSVALLFGSSAGFGIYVGSGAPTLSAGQGSLYLRSDGSSTSTRLYVNTTGSTVWTNFTSAA